MLWNKAWLETRWRFLIGLALLMISAAGIVIMYPQLVRLLPLAPDVDINSELGRQVRESVELSRTFRGYVWSQWFVQNLPQMWTLFAVLLGTGGLLASSAGNGTLFTLSLPVSRRRLLGVRAATGLSELFVLAMVPSLLLPLLSPSVGESYRLGDALVHGGCLFIGGSMFFSLALLLSTEFSDVWRPVLIVLCAAVVLGFIERIVPGMSHFSVSRVMNAETYFREGGLPWTGLFATAAVSVTVLAAAARNLARRDF